MAGRGSRFLAESNQKSQYSPPKPIIQVKNKPMVRWAVESLPFVNLPGRPANTEFVVEPSELYFIVLQEHEDRFDMSQILKKWFSHKIVTIVIPEVTRGATETVLAAGNFIDPNDDLLISDSDHFFDGSTQYEAILNKSSDVAGIIPVFKPSDIEPKWSYTLFDTTMRALQVGEKDLELAKKGAYANIGAYYFSKGKTFVDEAKEVIKNKEMFGPIEKQEFYIAPLYQRLIAKGEHIKATITNDFWGLGTPKDLEYFLKNYQP